MVKRMRMNMPKLNPDKIVSVSVRDLGTVDLPVTNGSSCYLGPIIEKA